MSATILPDSVYRAALSSTASLAFSARRRAASWVASMYAPFFLRKTARSSMATCAGTSCRLRTLTLRR